MVSRFQTAKTGTRQPTTVKISLFTLSLSYELRKKRMEEKCGEKRKHPSSERNIFHLKGLKDAYEVFTEPKKSGKE